jgi:hypothetical protein
MRFSLVTVALVAALARVQAADTAKPTIKVLADGFPAGHDTPEGAACDLVRAFIKRDVKLFRETCLQPPEKQDARDEYAVFLKDTAAEIEKEAGRKEPSPAGPKAIAKVFGARSLSRGGPASFGWAAFGYHTGSWQRERYRPKLHVGDIGPGKGQARYQSCSVKLPGCWICDSQANRTGTSAFGQNGRCASPRFWWRPA